MSPLDVIDSIRQSGGSVTAETNDLIVKAPAGTIGQREREILTTNKETLLRLLRQHPPAVDEDLRQAEQEAEYERISIQWVEGLDDPEGDEVLASAIRHWDSIVSPVVCWKCGAENQYRDVPIHNGESIRRDCRRCNRFISFPLWYGDGLLPAPPPAGVGGGNGVEVSIAPNPVPREPRTNFLAAKRN